MVRPGGSWFGWLLAAWLGIALALLAMEGLFVVWVVAAGVGWLVLAAARSIIRQQLAPPYHWPLLPNRHRLADNLTVPVDAVIDAAERDALSGG